MNESPQQELDFTGTKPKPKPRSTAAVVKALCLQALTPHSVLVYYSWPMNERPVVQELKGQEMWTHDPHEQWFVPNPSWLKRLQQAVANLNDMMEQHARERMAMQSVVQAILGESRQLRQDELPPRKERLIEVNEFENQPWGINEDDPNDIPF